MKTGLALAMEYYLTLYTDELADELRAYHAPKADAKTEAHNTSYTICPETAE
jgi:hypothetical protein